MPQEIAMCSAGFVQHELVLSALSSVSLNQLYVLNVFKQTENKVMNQLVDKNVEARGSRKLRTVFSLGAVIRSSLIQCLW